MSILFQGSEQETVVVNKQNRKKGTNFT